MTQLLPRITIVTPNYNQAFFLEATILSVINQGYPNLDYIIIDGGSTDSSIDIIKKYEHKLTYWKSEKDNGQYDAVQKGFLKSTGEIMTYINSDDLLAPGSLFTVAQIFTDYKQVEWIGGIPNHIDERSRIVSVGKFEKWNKFRYLNLDFKFIQQEGVFWRTSLWKTAGGYISTQYKLASDLELWSRFFQYTSFYMLPGILGSFRVRSHNQRSLEGMKDYLEEADTILSKMNRSHSEKFILNTSRSMLYRILNRKPLYFLFCLLGYNKIYRLLHEYPLNLSFDRLQQKFIFE